MNITFCKNKERVNAFITKIGKNKGENQMNTRQIITGICIAFSTFTSGYAKNPQITKKAESTTTKVITKSLAKTFEISKDKLGHYYLSKKALNAFKQRFDQIDTFMVSGTENLPDTTQTAIKNAGIYDKMFINANNKIVTVGTSGDKRTAYQFDYSGKEVKRTDFYDMLSVTKRKDEPNKMLFKFEDKFKEADYIKIGDYVFYLTGQCKNR